MSGTATAPWAFHSRDDIRNSSMYVAKLLGCDNSTDYYVDNYAGSGDEEDAGDGGEIEPAGNNQNATNEIDARIVECMKKANASDIVSQGYFVSTALFSIFFSTILFSTFKQSLFL